MARLRLEPLRQGQSEQACAEVSSVCFGSQVELKYPAASERPAQTARQAQPLSFRPGEAPKQAAELPQWAPDQVCPASVAVSTPLLSHTPKYLILDNERDNVYFTAKGKLFVVGGIPGCDLECFTRSWYALTILADWLMKALQDQVVPCSCCDHNTFTFTWMCSRGQASPSCWRHPSR